MYWFEEYAPAPNVPPPIKRQIDEELDVDDLFEELVKVHQEAPDAPLFDLLMTFYPQVCPTGIIDPIYNEIVTMEERTQKYGIFPYAGGQLDQPVKMLEAFDIIRSAIAMFHKKRDQEMDRESKQRDAKARTQRSR